MKALHMTGAALGLDHEALRDVASSLFRIPIDKISLAKLSNSQLAQFLGHLKHHQAGTPIQIPNAATARQVYLIRQLAKELRMDDNPERLKGFCARQAAGKRELNRLSIREAGRVIEGLKHLIAQQDRLGVPA
jgi:hypothetical protein